jgi:hypothetical protein
MQSILFQVKSCSSFFIIKISKEVYTLHMAKAEPTIHFWTTKEYCTCIPAILSVVRFLVVLQCSNYTSAKETSWAMLIIFLPKVLALPSSHILSVLIATMAATYFRCNLGHTYCLIYLGKQIVCPFLLHHNNYLNSYIPRLNYNTRYEKSSFLLFSTSKSSIVTYSYWKQYETGQRVRWLAQQEFRWQPRVLCSRLFLGRFAAHISSIKICPGC